MYVKYYYYNIAACKIYCSIKNVVLNITLHLDLGVLVWSKLDEI